MARGKSRCLPASNRRPLPMMSSLRVPDSGPLTFRSEISQGIARRRVGDSSVDQKENLRARRRGALPATKRSPLLSEATALLAAQHLSVDAQGPDGCRAIGADREIGRQRAGPLAHLRLELARARFRHIELDPTVAIVELARHKAR